MTHRRTSFAVLLALGLGAILALAAAGPGDVLLTEDPRLRSDAGDAETLRIHRLLASLDAAAASGRELATVTIDSPLDGSIFPAEMTAPTFLWHDASAEADAWLVSVEPAAGAPPLRLLIRGGPPPAGEIDPLAISGTNEIYEPTAYQASATAWRPGPAVWKAIGRASVAGPATVTVVGYRKSAPDRALSRGAMTLTTSRDPIGGSIFYRDVPLSPSPPSSDGRISPLPKGALPLIAWRIRDISQPESRVVLRDMPTCANCHSFSADGKTLAMDIDGPSGDKGAYAIAPIEERMVIRDEQVITWNSFADKPEGHKTLGFLSRISPDGRHVVSTVNEEIYVVNFPDYRFGQVFYPTRGILAVYSRETDRIEALPGADDPEYVHCDPDWTPDGKSLVFARARARDAYEPGRPAAEYAGDPNETPIQYDLYRMPFNEGRGGTPVPIAGASNNGMSNTFPKVSPDGKWIVFVKCKNGQLMRPDSELWIVPVEGGTARRMNCNTPLMNSWHSFSPSGRWLVFSSKSRTPYTQMFLTHIAPDGTDSPAVLIENSTAANRAVNLPEFVAAPPGSLMEITVPAVDHYRHFHRANKLAIDGRHREALAEFELALSKESEDSRIHTSISKSLLALGQRDEALEHVRRSLELNPWNIEMLTNLGYILAERGDYDEALESLDRALRIHRRNPLSWYNRATLLLRMGRVDAAIEDYDQAIRLYPDYADARTGRASALLRVGDHEAAIADLDAALEVDPSRAASWVLRGRARAAAGDPGGAADDLYRALAITPQGTPRQREIEGLLRQVRGGK